MREIKFRAWDVSTATMSYEVELHRFSDGYGFRMELNHFKKHWIHVEEKYVMQYTEIKDDGENEIYGSDVVKVTQPDGTQINGEVMLDKGQWVIRISDSKYEDLDLYTTVKKDGVRVIGNIYENPGLLKGDKD